MTYLLQFCGLSDPLQLFYLEQASGPVFAGFRPFQLDDLLTWAQHTGERRHWDLQAIHNAVIEAWMDRADLIRQWQRRLREEPPGRLVVAGLGTQLDWERRCEGLLLA
jgi:LmbE family N-acetylglucosaminyl deacetylase